GISVTLDGSNPSPTVPSDWSSSSDPFSIAFNTTVSPATPDGTYSVGVDVVDHQSGYADPGKPLYKVIVACGNVAAAAPTATKTADATGSFGWTLSKTVDPNEINDPVAGSGTFDYTVTATKDAGTWSVTGTISVTNPNTDPVTGVTVTDDIGDIN